MARPRAKSRSRRNQRTCAWNVSRTILTTATTLLAVLCLALFGGPVIRGFSLAMLFGLIIGTYSTVYIAAPLVIYTGLKRSGRLVGEESGPAGAAERMP